MDNAYEALEVAAEAFSAADKAQVDALVALVRSLGDAEGGRAALAVLDKANARQLVAKLAFERALADAREVFAARTVRQ